VGTKNGILTRVRNVVGQHRERGTRGTEIDDVRMTVTVYFEKRPTPFQQKNIRVADVEYVQL